MIKPKHPWYRYRGYLHFDLPVSLKNASSIVTNPDKVKSHSFYPFISYNLKSSKIQRDKTDGKIIEKEKLRPVSYASHIDSHIYSYYTYLLDIEYEKYVRKSGINKCVIAFRKLGKCNIHFANDAFNEIIKRKYCIVFALDIKGFFDNLDHSILKKSWCKILEQSYLPDDHYNIFKSLTKFSRVDKDELYPLFTISQNNPKGKNIRICKPKQFREIVRKNGLIRINKNKGIPQGSPISALLSNIYMINFDITMNNYMKKINGCYFRYCDDILCIAPPAYRNKIINIATTEIGKLNIEINKDKTEIREFKVVYGKLESKKPLQYLGFTFDGQRKLIRSAAFSRFTERMKSGIRLAKLTKIKFNRIRIQKGDRPEKLYKRKIYERYSHLGKRNFITYGFRSAKIMHSNTIRKQLKPLWGRLKEEISK